MNMYYRDQGAFLAEYQCDPGDAVNSEVTLCLPHEIIEKQSHCKRGVVPLWAGKICAHIDVQQDILFDVVCAASDTFEAAIIEYGTLPEQIRRYFTLRDSLHAIEHRYPTLTNLEARIYAAVRERVEELGARRYTREDGTELSISHILVDCGWQQEVVAKACRESKFAGITTVAKGISVRAKDVPLSQREPKPGERYGHHWMIRPNRGGYMMLFSDVNYWKTTVHHMWNSAPGPGSLRLYKASPEHHRMLAEHCNAEYCIRVSAKNQTVDEWEERPERPDNHRLDNIVGCLVALSVQGCKFQTHDSEPDKRNVKRISSSAIAKAYARG
jgi:phage terminase large subunit GpA-like protein